MNKTLKTTLWILAIIALPTAIVITILYVNDKALLYLFQDWLKEPGSLTTFIVGIGMYFPIINGLWKLILNLFVTVNTVKRSRTKSKDKLRVYDDDKDNYIYYDADKDIIDMQFKSPEHVKPNKLIEMIYAELKQRIKDFEKNDTEITK